MQSGERVVAVCSFSEWSVKVEIGIILNDEKICATEYVTFVTLEYHCSP